MAKPLIILKLGGSVITYKDTSLPKARTETLKSLGEQINELYKTGRFDFIIIHGTGSFGHPLAKKYNLMEGMTTSEEKLGYCQMEKQDLQLHQKVLDSLLKLQIPAIGLSPHSFVSTSGKKFSGFDLTIIRGFLEKDLVPVIHGDGIYDNKQGCTVLSGDIIMPYLAKQLQAEKVIFLSDVDGVFDADPKKNPQAKLIPEINNQNLSQILKGITSNNPNDVSGEMRGKVLEIKKRLPGVNVHIVNGLKPRNLLRLVAGYSTGTQLLFH